MRLWAVKNDKGEWLYSDEYNDWVDQLSQATFYDTFADADDDIKYWELPNTYVVELVDAPAKVVVSEDEAEMLKRAKASDYPVSAISGWCDEGEEDHTDVEDRLMRAYVNGWKVEKPKLWNVKVPHVKAQGGLWFLLDVDDELDATYAQDLAKKFTLAEIERYGLQDCERIEVTDHE